MPGAQKPAAPPRSGYQNDLTVWCVPMLSITASMRVAQILMAVVLL